MAKLKVLGRYTNTARNIDVHPGDEIEVKDALAEWLMNDAPGCFEDPNVPAKAPEKQQPSGEARTEANAILAGAQQVLAEAQEEAARVRAAAENEPKSFDLPPDGTTLATDATPPVVTGPDSGVVVVHHADEDEQQAVMDEQARKEGEAASDEELEAFKALSTPPVDKAVQQPARKKNA